MGLTKSKNIKEKIIIFISLCVQLLLRTSTIETMYEWRWRTTPYALTYDLGINSRFFVGTVISFFTDNLTTKMLYIIILVAEFVLICFITFLLGKVLDKTEGKDRTTVIYLICVFLACPANICLIFSQNNFGVFDVYLLIITALTLLVIKKKYLRWLIPVLCLTCVLIHQIYVCAYMSIICVPLLYETVKSKFKKSTTLLTLTTYFLICISFVYLQFFKKPLNFADENELFSYLQGVTDIPLTTEMLKWEYFSSVGTNFREFFLGDGWQQNIMSGVVTLIMLSPIYIFFVMFFKEAYKNTEKGIERFPILVSPLTMLIIIPAFVIAKDYDRWFASVVLCQFSLIFYFYVSRQQGVLAALEKLREKISENKIFFALFIVYFSSLMFVAQNSLGEVGQLIETAIKGG